MFDCIKYHLNIDAKSFGGFNNDQSNQEFKGASNERIIGAMPLYINDDHWKVSRLLIKPVLGWVSTLHTDGFDH